MQKISIFFFCCLWVTLLAGCGGRSEIFVEDISPTLTAITETEGSETAVVEPAETPVSAAAPDRPAIIIPAAPTSTFNPDGLGRGGSQFVSLNDPDVIPAAAATWLDDDDIVIGVVQNGEARAYPIRQMAFHHIANDTLGGEPYLVTY